MDTNAILSKLEKAAPGKVLESSRFGRAELLSVWVESSAVHAFAQAVNDEPSLKLQWLENLSFAEVGDSLVISWFLRSRETQVQLVIRSSVVIESERKPVEVLSVRDIWPMAAPIENEVAELFGVRFKKTSGETVENPRSLLTEEQAGESKFPMRKSYQLRSGQTGERSK